MRAPKRCWPAACAGVGGGGVAPDRIASVAALGTHWPPVKVVNEATCQ